MHLPTRDIITNCIFEIDENSSSEKLNEILQSDPYARMVYESEKENISIEAYLSGELTKEEKQKIDVRLTLDIEFKKEVQLRKKVNQVIVYENLINQMNAIHNPSNKKQHPTVLRLKSEIDKDEYNFKKYMVAASIILLISITAGMLSQSKKSPIESRLYAEYYEPFLAQKVNTTFILNSSSLDQARNKYVNGEYKEALIVFNELPNNIQIENEKYLYQGLSFMEMNTYDKAIDKFNQIIENQKSELLPQAYWYRGLCFLKLKKKNEAIEALQFIVDNQIYYHEKAAEILSKLN